MAAQKNAAKRLAPRRGVGGNHLRRCFLFYGSIKECSEATCSPQLRWRQSPSALFFYFMAA